MAQMSYSPTTVQVFFRELDFLLLRRHRLVPFPFTSKQYSRVLYSTKEWQRVSWLDEHAPEALHRSYRSMMKTESVIDLPWRDMEVHPQFSPVITFSFMGQPGRPFVRETDHQTLYRDNEVAPYFDKWLAAQRALMFSNLIAYKTIEQVIDTCTTWMQVKKLWPEMTAITDAMAKTTKGRLMGCVPTMADVDASRARNADPALSTLVAKRSDAVVKTVLQASMLPTLGDDRWNDKVPMALRWDRYNTRFRYTMHRDYSREYEYIG